MKQISRLRWASLLVAMVVLLYAWRSHPMIESMGGFTVVLMLTAALPYFCFSILRALGAEPPRASPPSQAQEALPPPPRQRYRGVSVEPADSMGAPPAKTSSQRYRGVPYSKTLSAKTKIEDIGKSHSVKKYRGVPLDPS
ncbi:MAG: hypothetical protein HC919_13045 [Oscillatoriales cyanobacterium SM2_2_1]|nr:hypothetical protein [Oscillatoriales cyanobacterium SM2_2_1]